MDNNIFRNLVKNVSSYNKIIDKKTKIGKIKSSIKFEKRKRSRSRSKDE